MSNYEQKEGDIAIFLVKDHEGNRPEWTGKALIDGKERDVSLWIKSDTMLAGQIKDKWVPDFSEAKQAVNDAPVDAMDDEIPF